MRKRIYKKPFLLYHWSPVERRGQILKHGLRINSRPVQHSQEFPHICFSDSPSLAWALSAHCMNTGGEWDLWMMWSNILDNPIGRREDLGFPTEYRVYENIPKKHIWHVGTKVCKVRKRATMVRHADGRIIFT